MKNGGGATSGDDPSGAGGVSQREAARRFGVALRTVQRWWERAGKKELEVVAWEDRRRTPHRVANKTDGEVERRICALRQELKDHSALGFRGAQAIAEQLRLDGTSAVPSLRTINRILARHGLLDGRPRVRRSAPPPGWYLPAVCAGQAELDSFDVIEDLPLEGFGFCQVFTARSLQGAPVGAWPTAQANTSFILEALQAHWRHHGLPRYAQFDNDTRFQGGHNHPDVVGRVIRLCLALEVTPVFAPPLQQGFQGMIEHFNGLWQQKVWQRSHHASLAALCACSERFTHAYMQRLARQRPEAPPRRPFPASFVLDWQRPPCGQLVYLRLTNERGALKVLGHSYVADPTWQNRLVRCEVDLDAHLIRCYRLRRREHALQPLLSSHPYSFPHRPFLLPKPSRSR